MKGTVRALTDEWMARLRQRIEEVWCRMSVKQFASTLEAIPSSVTLVNTTAPSYQFAQVVKHQSASYGCTGTVDWLPESNPYYPALRNDKAAHEFAVDVATRWLSRSCTSLFSQHVCVVSTAISLQFVVMQAPGRGSGRQQHADPDGWRRLRLHRQVQMSRCTWFEVVMI
jgi:hypothetical protein